MQILDAVSQVFKRLFKSTSGHQILDYLTHLEAYYFFLLLQHHLGIIFLQSAKTGRLYFANPIKKAKCTNKCLKNITKFSKVATKLELKTCFSWRLIAILSSYAIKLVAQRDSELKDST